MNFLTLDDWYILMESYDRKVPMQMLGQDAPKLFGLALRNAAEQLRWWSFWL